MKNKLQMHSADLINTNKPGIRRFKSTFFSVQADSSLFMFYGAPLLIKNKYQILNEEVTELDTNKFIQIYI